MFGFRSLVSKWAAGAALATSIVVAAPVNAAVIQLGFILDRSGSIGSTNWGVITGGLSNAINTLIPVGGPDTYEITVVTFASTASTDVGRVTINTAADRTNVATAIAAIPFSGGGTNFAAAFGQMFSTLTAGGAALLDSTYLNFATDGVGTDGVTQRNALIAAGVDNISIEGIGSGVDVTDLTTNYCYPQPCDATAPYNFPSQGFYIAVADAQAYAAAIGNKIGIITGGGGNTVPEPGTLWLLMTIGVVAVVMSTRNRNTRAALRQGPAAG